MPGWDVRVLGRRSGASELAAGEIGALAVKLPLPPGALPTLWQADDRFVHHICQRFPGFYQTADAGFIDEDGYIHVMTRTDDIINVAGASPLDRRDRGGAGGASRCRRMRRDRRGRRAQGAGAARPFGAEGRRGAGPGEIEGEAVALVRERIGPVASFKTALVVAGLPKTRSGKILRGTMRKIADGEDYPMPATIDDPAVLGEIGDVLGRAGYGERRGGC